MLTLNIIYQNLDSSFINLRTSQVIELKFYASFLSRLFFLSEKVCFQIAPHRYNKLKLYFKWSFIRLSKIIEFSFTILLYHHLYPRSILYTFVYQDFKSKQDPNRHACTLLENLATLLCSHRSLGLNNSSLFITVWHLSFFWVYLVGNLLVEKPIIFCLNHLGPNL